MVSTATSKPRSTPAPAAERPRGRRRPVPAGRRLPRSRTGVSLKHMTAEIEIRTVDAADRTAWGRLFRGYRDFYGMEHDERVIETVWGWLMDPAHELVGHVAVREGRPVAIAHWRLFARPSRGATAIFLDDLFTDPDQRGTGVGSTLIANPQRD